MRTSKLYIRGKEYLCCFSTRVLLALEDRGKTEAPMKSATEMLAAIMDQNGSLRDSFWLLHEMLVAGSRYARLEGLENPEPPSLEDMVDVIGVEDYPAMFAAIGEAVTAGQRQTVEAAFPKNAETTQADQDG